METNTGIDLSSIAELAHSVKAEADQADAAHQELTTVKAALLESAIRAALPALRAIGSRRLTACQRTHHADANYGGGRDEETWTDERSFPLNSFHEPQEDGPNGADAGHIKGRGLFVREDGTLFALEYSGTWSRWQGSSFGWTSKVVEYRTALDAVSDNWGAVDKYVANLANALERAKGSRGAALQKARIQAEQMRAALAVLGR